MSPIQMIITQKLKHDNKLHLVILAYLHLLTAVHDRMASLVASLEKVFFIASIKLKTY